MKACPEAANACPTQGWRAENWPSLTEQISQNCKKTERVEYRVSCQRMPDQGTQDRTCKQVPEGDRELKNRKHSKIRVKLSEKI